MGWLAQKSCKAVNLQYMSGLTDSIYFMIFVSRKLQKKKFRKKKEGKRQNNGLRQTDPMGIRAMPWEWQVLLNATCMETGTDTWYSFSRNNKVDALLLFL